MPPVGAYVSALSVISERCTASRHVAVVRATDLRPAPATTPSCVRRHALASIGDGGVVVRREPRRARTAPSRRRRRRSRRRSSCPRRACATGVREHDRVGTGDRAGARRRWCGPTARPSRSRSGRRGPCASAPVPTGPRRCARCRRLRSRIGMQSVTRTPPSSVCERRSRARACRRGTGARSRAARRRPARCCQRPCGSSPSSAAKHAPESKRGTHSQSIEPSLPTSAAVCVSPMSA